ncbi:MAG: hypothetical protein E7005_01475 [Alphaproteobacteria bacterium]|nr:hypothetical protein [Alphaproteobacteria bacterium]
MIFCDMDGVLVDFDGSFERKYGILPYKLPRQELWQTVLDTKDYWVNLPKLDDADKLVKYLNNHGFQILTGLNYIQGLFRMNIFQGLLNSCLI